MQISFMQECYRKMVHMSSLIYPLMYLVITKNTMLIVLLALCIIVFLWDILRILNFQIKILKFLNNILRHEEKSKKKLCGATWFLMSCFLLVLFFPKDIAIMSMLVLIISDSAAALIGRRFGKVKIFTKTLEGSLAFFISGLIIIFGSIYFFKLNYDYSLVFLAVFCTTMAELVAKKIKIDDNFLVTMVFAIILNM